METTDIVKEACRRVEIMAESLEPECRAQASAIGMWTAAFVAAHFLADAAEEAEFSDVSRWKRDVAIALVAAGITAAAVVIGAALF